MSITFFSVFFPEIFHTEIKNKFITDKQKLLSPKQKQKNLLEKLDTEYCKTNTNKDIRIFKTKTKYFRTSENISTNNTNNNLHNNNIRDIISSKKNLGVKKKIGK